MLTGPPTRWLTSLFLATVTLGSSIATAAAAPPPPLHVDGARPDMISRAAPMSPLNERQYVRADLTITEIKPETVPLVGDQPARLCAIVKNNGAIAANGALVVLFVDNVFAGQQTVSLGAGRSATVCFDNVMASGGQYHRVSASVDVTGRIPEWNDQNNLKAQSLYWTDGRPDLTIGYVAVRGKEDPDGFMDCDPGKNTVYALIRNGSSAPAGKFIVRLRVDGKEPRNDEFTIEHLGPGEQALAEFTKAKVEGKDVQHKIRLVVDADFQVMERDETNNVRELTVSCVNEERDDD